jgi:hypothetical protein
MTLHSCAIWAVASRYGQACATELEFLREVLPEAEIERVAHKVAGAYVCGYELRPRTAKPRVSRGRPTRQDVGLAGRRVPLLEADTYRPKHPTTEGYTTERTTTSRPSAPEATASRKVGGFGNDNPTWPP